MSNFSTPISQIRNSGNNSEQLPVYNPQQQINNQEMPQNVMTQQNMAQTQSNLVDTLLDELEQQPEYQQDTNIAHSQYAMDDVNIPPPSLKRNEHYLQSENTQPISVNNMTKDNTFTMDNNMNNYMNNTINNNSMVDKLLIEGKPLIIVFVLFLILSLHQVNRIIFSFVPRLLLENGQLSLYAILLKSVLACVLYYGFMKLL